jgi:integrase
MVVSHNGKIHESGLKTNGEFVSQNEPQQPSRPRDSTDLLYRCPRCGSDRLNRNGFFVSVDGFKAQKWLCRNCDCRFTEKPNDIKENRTIAQRHVCVILQEKTKNMAPETDAKTVLEESQDKFDVKGKLVEYAFYMERQGYNAETIRGNSGALRALLIRGASLFDSNTVKDVLAREQRKFENGEKGWSSNRRRNIINAYSMFLRINDMKWEKPKCKTERKNPFIPREQEINELIAGSPLTVATLLQLLKETAVRIGEALRLKWIDIDFEKYVIMLNEPEKGSDPRIFNKSDLSPKLMNMLNGLPRINERLFGGKTRNSLKNTFSRVRARLANKLQNPRLLAVHFHTLRHWSLTMYQHNFHDLVLTARFAGHRNVNNTMKYMHLAEMLFNDAQDDFIVKTARTPEEAARLIEVGFQFQDVIKGVHLYKKRK